VMFRAVGACEQPVRSGAHGLRSHRLCSVLSLRSFVGLGLNMPNGVALRGGTLDVTAINPVLRYDAIESRLDIGRDSMNIANVMRRLPCERLESRSFDRVFYPPPQKATGENPWMNARWVPSVALAKEGVLRPSPSEVGYGRRRSEGSAR
jgi:hypothetical protein